MSTFDTLCAEFDAWRQRYLDDQRASVSFVYQFIKRLQDYIGAPHSYQILLSEQTAPYIKAKKIIHKADEKYITDEPDNIFDTIQRCEDGYWEFAVCITLESAPNMFPKHLFVIPIYFIIDGDFAKLRITKRSDGEFNYKLSDDTGRNAAYAFVVELLREILNTKPVDQVQKKVPIGFTYPSST